MDNERFNNVNRIPDDLQILSTRVHGILGRLHSLKAQMSSSFVAPASHSLSSQHINTSELRDELRRAKETVTRFKQMIVAASSSSHHDQRPGEKLAGSFESVGLRHKDDDKSKSLVDRLGGELLLETVVELSYSRFLTDSRLRAFFDLDPRKIASIKRRLLQFLTGYLGGKSSYDESNLKPAHYHLNITDYHLEAFLEILREVMEKDLKCHSGAVEDVIASLSKVRKDIVTGYTIRCELARINTERGIEILFRKLGGLEGIVKFIDRLYDVVQVDHRIRRFFTGSNFEAIKRGQRAFITHLVGGPRLYKGLSLEDIHKNLGIDDFYFDCYLQDAEKALSWLGVDEAVTDQVLIQLESVRGAVLGRKRGVAAAGSPITSPVIDQGFYSNMSESFLTTSSMASSTTSLLNRLGGEERLIEAVDIFFKGSLNDPRIRYHIEIAQRREKAFKRSLVNVLLTIAGASPARYDLTQLRGSHFNLNITDYLFDTWLSNLGDGCVLAGAPASAVKELTGRLSKLRSEITGGCTIRLEMAQQRTEASSAGPPMCASLVGGAEGIKQVISKLYELMLADVRVSVFFQGSKVDGIIRSQGQYLANLLGAHETYMGRDLEKVHARLNVSDFHFDCFLECFTKAVIACGFSRDAADECVVLVESHRRIIVNAATRNFSMRIAQKTLVDGIDIATLVKSMKKQILSASARSDRGIGLRFLLERHKDALEEGKQAEKLIEAIMTSNHSNQVITTSMISDDHFDSFVELLDHSVRSLVDPAVAPERIDDFLSCWKAIRGIVTTGYRMRSEQIQRHDVLSELGGEEWVRRKWPDLSCILIPVFSGNRIPTSVDLPENLQVGLSEYQLDCLVHDICESVSDPSLRERMEIVLAEGLKKVFVPPWWLARKETLLSRLGGESAIEQLVDGAIDKLTGWTLGGIGDESGMIVKSFFDIPKSRMRTFKRRITRFLINLLSPTTNVSDSTERFGSNYSGVSVSSGGNNASAPSLRLAHSHLNISDVQFDAFVVCMTSACKDLGMGTEVDKEFSAILNSLRGEVVIGWTVRSNEANNRLLSATSGQTVYEKMGGTTSDPGLENFLARMYELVERDRRINDFFLGSKFNYIRDAQGKYILSLLGGQVAHSRPLFQVHKVYNITSYHFDCFLNDVLLAARDCGATDDTQDDIAVILEPLRDVVTCGGRKSYSSAI